MNLLHTIWTIKSLKDQAQVALAMADNTKHEGESNYPYAFGRLSFTTKEMARLGDSLNQQLPDLEKVYEVLGILGIDGDVIDRILALKTREQGSLSEDIAEKLDYHEVLNAPVPEVVENHCPECNEYESECECTDEFKPTHECLSDCYKTGEHSILCQHSC